MKYAQITHNPQSFARGGGIGSFVCFLCRARARGVKGDRGAADTGAAVDGYGAAAAVHAGHAHGRNAAPGGTDGRRGQPDDCDCECSTAEAERAERRRERQDGHRIGPGAVTERLSGRVEGAHRQARQDDAGFADADSEYAGAARSWAAGRTWRLPLLVSQEVRQPVRRTLRRAERLGPLPLCSRRRHCRRPCRRRARLQRGTVSGGGRGVPGHGALLSAGRSGRHRAVLSWRDRLPAAELRGCDRLLQPGAGGVQRQRQGSRGATAQGTGAAGDGQEGSGHSRTARAHSAASANPGGAGARSKLNGMGVKITATATH